MARPSSAAGRDRVNGKYFCYALAAWKESLPQGRIERLQGAGQQDGSPYLKEDETMAVITLNKDRSQGKINRNIYGHFSEHLGRCIYQGLYVG